MKGNKENYCEYHEEKNSYQYNRQFESILMTSENWSTQFDVNEKNAHGFNEVFFTTDYLKIRSVEQSTTSRNVPC